MKHEIPIQSGRFKSSNIHSALVFSHEGTRKTF